MKRYWIRARNAVVTKPKTWNHLVEAANFLKLQNDEEQQLD